MVTVGSPISRMKAARAAEIRVSASGMSRTLWPCQAIASKLFNVMSARRVRVIMLGRIRGLLPGAGIHGGIDDEEHDGKSQQGQRIDDGAGVEVIGNSLIGVRLRTADVEHHDARRRQSKHACHEITKIL